MTLCRGCEAGLTPTDVEAGRCTQCDWPLVVEAPAFARNRAECDRQDMPRCPECCAALIIDEAAEKIDYRRPDIRTVARVAACSRCDFLIEF